MKSLEDFQTGASATADITLDVEQLISHIITAIVETVISLQDSCRNINPVSEVYDVLKFMTFWRRLFLNELVMQLII